MTRLCAVGALALALSACGSGGNDTPSPRPQVSLAASPSTISAGQTTTLTWHATDASSCRGSGSWSGTGPASGSLTVQLDEPGQYNFILTCSGPGGSGGAQAFVQVTGTPAPTLTLSANPSAVAAGGTTTLTWSSTNASGCTASKAWSGSKAASGSEPVNVPGMGAYDFTLSCTDGTRTVTKTVTVTGYGPTVTLSIFPAKVTAGKTVTLRWNAQYVDSCTATGDWSGEFPASGVETLTLPTEGTRNFHLSCSSASASVAADASAVATAAPAFPPATAYRMNEGHDGVIVTTNGVQHPLLTLPSWTQDLGAPLSYPLIADGRVFVTTAIPGGGYGNRLYALNPATGAILWGPVTVPGTYFGSGLAYEEGRVFVLMFDGALRAFNAANGAALWTTQVPGGYWYDGSPVAYGGIVFLVGNYALSAVNAKTGAVLWNAPGGTTDWVSPAVSSEGVYFLDGYDCSAYAYQPVSGAAIWDNTRACSGSWGHTGVLKDGMYYGRVGDALALFDAPTGTYVNQLASKRAPSITGTAMIAQNSGTLSATRLSDYAPAWTFTGDDGLVTAPVVVNNTVFVGSSSGKVFGVDATTGEQTWVGTAPAAINADSENGGPQPPSGPAAGENLLIFASGTSLVAWQFQ